MQSITEKAKAVTLLAMDVDGVLTNGSLYFGNSGEEMKAFSILDGLGIKLLRDAGVTPALITGRRSELVARRAAELGIELIYQGREDKRVALEELCRDQQLELSQVAYVGDDLPDLGAIRAAGQARHALQASALPSPMAITLSPPTPTCKPGQPVAAAPSEKSARSSLRPRGC